MLFEETCLPHKLGAQLKKPLLASYPRFLPLPAAPAPEVWSWWLCGRYAPSLMVHTGPPQTGIPRHLEQPLLPGQTHPGRDTQASTQGAPWAERAPSVSLIPTQVYFHRHCSTVLGSGLIVDTYGEEDTESRAHAGTKETEMG